MVFLKHLCSQHIYKEIKLQKGINGIDKIVCKMDLILFGDLHLRVKAGVCRPCETIELTATSCNFSLCRRVEKVCVDRQLLRYS